MFITLLFPAATWLLLFDLFEQPTQDLRKAFALATVAWGVLLTALTEAASACGLLGAPALAIGWACFTIALVALRWRRFTRDRWPHLSAVEHALRLPLAVAGTLCALTGLVALLAAPNTWDVLTYHLPRVMHWLQQGDLQHFQTSIYRELVFPPFAELVVLNLYALAGGDRLVNLPQWFSFIGCAIGVSAIGARLGLERHSQAYAAAFSATVPMALLQASSAKNDLVLSLLLLCALLFALDLLRRDHETPPWLDALGLGASLGLAALTKGVAYPLALPLVVGVLVFGARRYGWRAAAPLAAAGVLALALNVGHFARNQATYGSPLPSGERSLETNEAMSPGLFASNALRNLAMHLAISDDAVAATERATRGLHALAGVNPDDPRTSYTGNRFRLPEVRVHEHDVPCAAHLLLTLLAVILVFVRGRLRRRPVLVAYTVGLLLAGAAYCLTVKWQPWASRLHLPMFIAAAVLVAAALEEAAPRIRAPLLGLLFVLALYFTAASMTRPLLASPFNVVSSSRAAQYFASHPGYLPHFARLRLALSDVACERVGLVSGADAMEYPAWLALRAARSRQIEHLLLPQDRATPLTHGEPGGFERYCLILSLQPDLGPELERQGCQRAWSSGPLSLWTPPGSPRQ